MKGQEERGGWGKKDGRKEEERWKEGGGWIDGRGKMEGGKGEREGRKGRREGGKGEDGWMEGGRGKDGMCGVPTHVVRRQGASLRVRGALFEGGGGIV